MKIIRTKLNKWTWHFKQFHDIVILNIFNWSSWCLVNPSSNFVSKLLSKICVPKVLSKISNNIITFFIFCIAGYTFLRNLHVHLRARRLWEKYPCGMQIMDIISSTNKCRHSQFKLLLCLRRWEDVKKYLSTS